MSVGEHRGGREVQSRAIVGLTTPVPAGCQGDTSHQGCMSGGHTITWPHSTQAQSVAMGRVQDPSLTHAFLHSGVCVVLVPGWGEAVTTSPAGHHFSVSKLFPVMPSNWAALMAKTIKTVGIFAHLCHLFTIYATDAFFPLRKFQVSSLSASSPLDLNTAYAKTKHRVS